LQPAGYFRFAWGYIHTHEMLTTPPATLTLGRGVKEW
jgi:hypothetical protein